MRRTLGGALLGAAVWLGACTPPPFVSPAQGGPKWAKLTTRHFTLYTDVPPDAARPAAAALEAMYTRLEDVAFPYAQKPKGRFEVTLFQREDAYREIGPANAQGQFMREAHDPDGKPMVVLARDANFGTDVNQALPAILQHELTHHFVAFYFPTAPPWLNEGLASFYETLTLGNGRCAGGSDAACVSSKLWGRVSTVGGGAGTDASKVMVGLPPNAWVFGHNSSFLAGTNRGVFTISRDELPSASALVSLDRKRFYGFDDSPASAKAQTLHYAAAWRLVHTMTFSPPPLKAAFEQYLYALSKGDEPRAAWGSALRDGGVSPDLLEAEYQKGIARWPAVYGVNAYAPRQPPQPHEQPMTEAEVRLLWARVRPWRGESLKKVGEELDAALAADPSFAPAYVLRGQWRAANRRGDAEVLADLRKAVALAPDDFRTTYALAGYLFDRAEKDPGAAAAFAAEEAKLVERLREHAGSTPAWNFLAWYDAKKGEPGRGLPFARKAIDADPACFECYDTAALLLYRLGRLNEAVSAQRSAVHLTPEGLKIPDMLERLQTFEKELAARPVARP